MRWTVALDADTKRSLALLTSAINSQTRATLTLSTANADVALNVREMRKVTAVLAQAVVVLSDIMHRGSDPGPSSIAIGTPAEEAIQPEEVHMQQLTCHANRQLDVPIYPKDLDGNPRDFNEGCVVAAGEGDEGLAPYATGPTDEVRDGKTWKRYDLHLPPPSTDVEASTGATRTFHFGDGDQFPSDAVDVLFIAPDAQAIDVGAPVEETIGAGQPS